MVHAMVATIRQRAMQSRSLMLAFALMVTGAVAVANTEYRILHDTTTKLKVTVTGTTRNALVLTATVLPSKAAGTVTFKEKRPKDKSFANLKTVPLKAGVAEWTMPFSPIGLSVEATCNGSKTYDSSTSNIVPEISAK